MASVGNVRSAKGRDAGGLPLGGPQLFRREGDYWTIAFEGRSIRMKDSKGVQYMAVLLGRRGHEIHVTDLEVPHAGPGDDSSMFARMNLDTAGFTHTLHILEGIAAEGKGWIDRDPHTNGERGGPRPATDAA